MRKKRAKYFARKITVEGIRFDSQKEARRYIELSLFAKEGIIKNLRRQVPFELYPPLYYNRASKEYHLEKKPKDITVHRGKYYYADFVYEMDGETVVEDVKGYRTSEYKRKRNLMKKIYGIVIRET